MSLDVDARIIVSDGRAVADIQDGIVPGRSGLDPRGVYANRGCDQSRDFEIRRREPKLAATSVSPDDWAYETVRAAEQITRQAEAAIANSIADPGAADGGSGEIDGFDPVGLETHRGGHFCQQTQVSCALVAEGEVRSNGNRSKPAEICGQVPNKIPGRQMAEREIEVKQQRGAEATIRQDLEPLFDGIDQRGGLKRSQNRTGVLIEGDDHGNGLLSRGIGEGLGNDGLVAEVDSIKEAQGQANRKTSPGQLGRMMDNPHRERLHRSEPRCRGERGGAHSVAGLAPVSFKKGIMCPASSVCFMGIKLSN